MYDITKPQTFLNIEKWFSELREHAEYNIVVLLVGNKSDMKAQWAVSTEDAQKYATQRGLYFIETSALDSTNVDKAFLKVIHDIYQQTVAESQ